MISDSSFISRIELGEAEYVYQEGRELVALGGKSLGALGEAGIVGQKARVVDLEHAGAGARGSNDIIEGLESLDDLPGDRRRLFAIA